MAGPTAPCFTQAELLPEPEGGYVEKLFGSVQALLAVAGFVDLVPLTLEQRRERTPAIDLVVND